MAPQENLWASPARPTTLSLHVERLWTEGEDVVELRASARGSKLTDPVWSRSQRWEGVHAHEAVAATVEALVLRHGGSLWDVSGKWPTAEQWERHRHVF